MTRESQIAILRRIEVLLKDIFSVLDGVPHRPDVTRRGPTAKKSPSDFYKIGAFEWTGRGGVKMTPTAAAQCLLCKQVTKTAFNMEGKSGHLWLKHRKDLKAVGIKY